MHPLSMLSLNAFWEWLISEAKDNPLWEYSECAGDEAAMKTIVVGSGMIGASIAYHLVVRGAEVTVVTGDRLGGIATSASFAWINAAPGNSRQYFEFRLFKEGT